MTIKGQVVDYVRFTFLHNGGFFLLNSVNTFQKGQFFLRKPFHLYQGHLSLYTVIFERSDNNIRALRQAYSSLEQNTVKPKMLISLKGALGHEKVSILNCKIIPKHLHLQICVFITISRGANRRKLSRSRLHQRHLEA